jgi:4-amino-4-deoxy-L-arabinose transferase-like glycosyltransferase
MRNYLLLAAIVLVCIIPFSSRAVYLDEHIFLQIARSAQTNWMFPQDTPEVFFGIVVPNFAAHTHPPVGEYFLALLYLLLGSFHEVPFRLAFSIFPIAAVLGFYSLARRFTPHPFLVTLMLAFSPAFFVYSPTLMMDIPMLAFLLVGFALYFGYVQGRRANLPLASLCLILAVGTGYTALVPL